MKFNFVGVHKGHGGEPLKTAPEMAEALGITVRAMATYLGQNAGPAPAIKVNSSQCAMSRTYYKPSAVKKWWRDLLAVRPELAVKHGL